MTASGDHSAQVERLAEEYFARLRAGEAPDTEAYTRSHPELASEIRRVILALSLMENIKPSERELRETYAAAERLGQNTPPDPDRVGDYDIVRRIGRGGMGRVFEARDSDGTRVAVKLIHPHLLEEQQYVDRFLQEAQLGQRIEHPNVVRTLAAGTFDSPSGPSPYLVLEFVQGQDLKGLLSEVQVVPERLARHIGLKLADALSALHAEGIIHRDVKPENVVITPDEDVKLMDMGVGLLLERERRLSQTGQFVGSLLYAAPEQFRGDTLDGRTDLYSLGLMLYELVAGALPLGGIPERAAGLQADAWCALDDVSPYFRAVLQSLLHPAPTDRLASSAELYSILRQGESSDWWQGQAAARRPDPMGLFSTSKTAVPFHGRVTEMRVLTEALEAARHGQGGVVWIEGDAGIGKSRLVAQWLRATSETARPDAIFARHEPGEHGAAATPLAHAIVQRLGAVNLRDVLASSLESSPLLVEPLTNYLLGGHALGAGTKLPTSALGPAYLAILRMLAREAPVVLVIEDLHFAPNQVHNTFLHLARNLAHDRILLVGTTRPGSATECGAEVERLAHGTALTLTGLTGVEGNELFDEAVGEWAHGRFTKRVVDQAGGNPLFLLELARSWRREGPGTVSRTSQLRIPSSIRSIFDARLSGLAESDRELLDVAACYGAEFDPIIVAAAAERGEVATLKALARMDRAGGVLRTQGLAYRFEHHLLHEAIYESIHPALRERQHASIARGLSTHPNYTDVPPEHLDGERATLIARQWLLGAEPDAAAPYLPRALEWLAQRHAVARLFALRDLVEPYLDRFPEVLRLRLFLQVTEFEFQRLPTKEILARVERALSWSDPAASPGLHAELLLALARARMQNADLKGALPVFEECLALIERVGDNRLKAYALQFYARALLGSDRGKDAIDHLETALELANNQGDTMREIQIQGGLCSAYLYACRLADGEFAARRIATLARQAGDPTEEANGHMFTSRVLAHQGQYRGVIREAAEAKRLFREFALARNLAVCNMDMSRAYLHLGEMKDAGRAANEALTQAEALQHASLQGLALLELTRASLALGNLAQAVEHTEAAASVRTTMHEPLPMFQVSLTAHCVHLACGRFDRARKAIGEATSALGSKDPDEIPTLLEARAQLLAEEGRFEEAGGLLDNALRMYRQGQVAHAIGGVMLKRARVSGLAGDEEAARQHFVDVAEWAREREIPTALAVSLAHLARHSTTDLMAAKVLVERDRERIHYVALMEAYFALWEATWSLPFLKEAKVLLAGLRVGARPEDREHLANVALYRAIDTAG